MEHKGKAMMCALYILQNIHVGWYLTVKMSSAQPDLWLPEGINRYVNQSENSTKYFSFVATYWKHFGSR